MPMYLIRFVLLNIWYKFSFGHIMWHVGSYFPNQGSNPHPVLWKHRVLTIGPPGAQHHPSGENWIKDLLSVALPTRARPSFPHSQSLHQEACTSLLSSFIRMQTKETGVLDINILKYLIQNIQLKKKQHTVPLCSMWSFCKYIIYLLEFHDTKDKLQQSLTSEHP